MTGRLVVNLTASATWRRRPVGIIRVERELSKQLWRLSEHRMVPVVLHHESGYWATRCQDQFDRLHQEGAERAKIMAIAIHPYISGQPHRIKYLEQVYDHCRQHEGVVFMNGAEILDWYRGAQGGKLAP